MENYFIGYLLMFLVFGGGFLLGFVALVVSSRQQELKRRLIYIACALFCLITQHVCYHALDNFGSAFGNASGLADLAVLSWLIAGLWAAYLLRKTRYIAALSRLIHKLASGVYNLAFRTAVFIKETICRLHRANISRWRRMETNSMDSSKRK